jgi:hypothetical protein
LDAGGVLRTEAHTDLLCKTFNLQTLWQDHGIVGNFMVIVLLSHCHDIDISKPFTHGFPRAEIYELLSPDILHQVIKGTFKDHLVTWVEEYLHIVHPEARALAIMADIDRRYAMHLLTFPS